MDGKALTFERVALRGSNFVMRDSETGSRWQQLTGECFDGPLKGRQLEMIPFLLTTWGEWRSKHPGTLALAPEPAYKANYAVMASRNSIMPSQPPNGIIHEDSRLPVREQVAGVAVRDAYKAYPLALLRKQSVLNDAVGPSPVLLVYDAPSETTIILSRLVDGRTLTFHAAKSGAVDTLIDDQTQSRWTPYGECTAGRMKGRKLDTIVPQLSFWFAWAEFHPDTQVYSATGR